MSHSKNKRKIKSIFPEQKDHKQFILNMNAIETSAMINNLNIPSCINQEIAEYSVGDVSNCINIKCKNKIIILDQDRNSECDMNCPHKSYRPRYIEYEEDKYHHTSYRYNGRGPSYSMYITGYHCSECIKNTKYKQCECGQWGLIESIGSTAILFTASCIVCKHELKRCSLYSPYYHCRQCDETVCGQCIAVCTDCHSSDVFCLDCYDRRNFVCNWCQKTSTKEISESIDNNDILNDQHLFVRNNDNDENDRDNEEEETVLFPFGDHDYYDDDDGNTLKDINSNNHNDVTEITSTTNDTLNDQNLFVGNNGNDENEKIADIDGENVAKEILDLYIDNNYKL